MIENIKNTFRALQYRNYRLFFGGQGISLIGTWLQMIAMSWLVSRLTNSVLLLGVVGFSSNFPIFLCTPFAGVLSDRLNKRYMLIATQSLSMIQAFALSVLVLTHSIAVWHIIVLSVVLGIANGFDMPARQSFIVEMVERREDLSNAIALNSAMFNGARFIGPSIGGILIALFGEGICFLLNGISYIGVIIALLLMRVSKKAPRKENMKFLDGLKEGFHFTFGFLPIRSIIFLVALTSLTAMPYTVVMPVFARDILHGGAHTLGFLMASIGAGALIGAIYLASRKSIAGLIKFIPIGSIVFSASLLIFSFSHFIMLSVPALFLAGIGFMVQLASCNTIIQTIVDDDKRGRVMSLYSMSFIGLAPFGSLLAGGAAKLVGVQATIAAGGLCCIAGALLFLRALPDIWEQIQPIYQQKGIAYADKEIHFF